MLATEVGVRVQAATRATAMNASLRRAVAATPGRNVDPVCQLIQRRLRETGRSYAQAAQLGGLPKSTFHDIARHGVRRFPGDGVVEAIASAIDVPAGVVRSAVAEAAGVAQRPARVDPDAELLAARVAELTPAQRRHVLALVESMLGDRE